jgi:predicted Zn-dependent protease
MPTIAVAPIGLAHREAAARLGSLLARVFHRAVVTAPRVRLPVGAYDRERRQYLSPKLLDVIAAARTPEWERILGVADVDLFVPTLNFVFGESDARRAAALISLWRLHEPGHRMGKRFLERAAKEAIYELARTYGLQDCDDRSCVMRSSDTLAGIDRKQMRFGCRSFASTGFLHETAVLRPIGAPGCARRRDV